MFHSFVLTPYGQDIENEKLTTSFLTSNWELYPEKVNGKIESYEYNYLPFIIHPTNHSFHDESGTEVTSSPLVNGRWYRQFGQPWSIGRVDREQFVNPVVSMFDLAIPTSFFPFPSFHRVAYKENLRQGIREFLNPDTMASLREDEEQTNNTDIFLINQQTGHTPFSYPKIIHDGFNHKYGFQYLSPYYPDFSHCPISRVEHQTTVTIPSDWGAEGIGILTPLIRGMLTNDHLDNIHQGGQEQFEMPFIAKTNILEPNFEGYDQTQISHYDGIVSIGKISIQIQMLQETYDTQAGWRYSTTLRRQLRNLNNRREGIRRSIGHPFSEPERNPHQIHLPNVVGKISPTSHEQVLMTDYRVTTTVLSMYQCRETDDGEGEWIYSPGPGERPPIVPDFQSFPILGNFLNQRISNGLSLLDFVRDVRLNIPPEFFELPNDASSPTERNSVRPPGAPMAMDRNQRVWNGRTDIGMSIVQDWLPRAVSYHSHPNFLWNNIQGGN